MMTRRKYLSQAALLAGGSALAGSTSVLARAEGSEQHEGHAMAAPTPSAAQVKGAAKRVGPRGGLRYTPVVTPDGSTLPFVMKDGVKEFHLIAEPVKREFADGMSVNCWGYNGSTP